MATDADSGDAAPVQYLEELEGWVLDEQKVITFRWLALVLSVTANAAKKMLFDFSQRQGKEKVAVTYIIMGRSASSKFGPGAMEVKLVSAEGLDRARKALKLVTSVHVYSVQAAPSAQASDLSTQLWATGLEHNKEMLEHTTEAGANLRSHRLSGVSCPDIVDVRPPTAPSPPDYVQEQSQSPLGRPRQATGKGTVAAAAAAAAAGGRKNASAAEKPKGKAINPKDFFAGAGGNEGKGKTGKGKGGADEKGAAGAASASTGAGTGVKKAGGIGSFFGKATVAPKKKPAEGIPKPAEDKKKRGIDLVDDGIADGSKVNGSKGDRSKGNTEAEKTRDEKNDKIISTANGSRTGKRRKSLDGSGSSDDEEMLQNDSGAVDKERSKPVSRADGDARTQKQRKSRLSKVVTEDEEDEEDEGGDQKLTAGRGASNRKANDKDEMGNAEDSEEEWIDEEDNGGKGGGNKATAKKNGSSAARASPKSGSRANADRKVPASNGSSAKEVKLSGGASGNSGEDSDDHGSDVSKKGVAKESDRSRPASASRTEAEAEATAVQARRRGSSATSKESTTSSGAKKSKNKRESTNDQDAKGKEEEEGGEVGESSPDSRAKRGRGQATKKQKHTGKGGVGEEEEEEGDRGVHGGGRGKRKGRYDSDEESEEDKNEEPVSGAMDKFTSHSGGNGKSTKRTKIVVQNRTYMKGGYMTTAAEEVEVTDDEEEPLQPAQTNKTPTPAMDNKKKPTASVGVENKSGGGGGSDSSAAATGANKVKGASGRGKKVAPKPSGKQASMMSFFSKKA